MKFVPACGPTKQSSSGAEPHRCAVDAPSTSADQIWSAGLRLTASGWRLSNFQKGTDLMTKRTVAIFVSALALAGCANQLLSDDRIRDNTAMALGVPTSAVTISDRR